MSPMSENPLSIQESLLQSYSSRMSQNSFTKKHKMGFLPPVSSASNTNDTNLNKKVTWYSSQKSIQMQDLEMERSEFRQPVPTIRQILNEETSNTPHRYFSVPGLFDGFFILDQAKEIDPANVYVLNVAGKQLRQTSPEDYISFINLHEMDASDNELSMGSLSLFPALYSLNLCMNGIRDMSGVEGNFIYLQRLDVSYNCLSQEAIAVLATLPKLSHLELSHNSLSDLPLSIVNIPLKLLESKPNTVQTTDQKEDIDDKGERQQETTTEFKHSEEAPPGEGLPNEAEVYNDKGISTIQKEDRGDNLNPSTLTEDQPAQTELSVEASLQNRMVGCQSDVKFLVTDVGFQKLYSLNLSRNRLKTLNTFLILGRLPSLRELNLDYNHIRKLNKILSQLGFNENTEKGKVKKQLCGFLKLRKLHLAYNGLDSPEDIESLSWFPALNHVYLEGNPIMKPATKYHVMVKCTAPLHYDAVSILKDQYGIKVVDTSYLGKPAIPPLLSWKQRLHKARHARGAKPLSSSSDYTKVNENVFHAPTKLTEKDISALILTERVTQKNKEITNKIVDSLDETGEALLEKALKKVPNYRKPLSGWDSFSNEDNFGISRSTSPELVYRQSNSAAPGTFLTAVDLVERGENLHGRNSMEKEEEFDLEGDEELEMVLAEEEKDLEDFMESLRLPHSMKASLILLKHALNNPVVYWKVIESGYAQPTFASRLRTKDEVTHVEGTTRKESKDTRTRYQDASRKEMSAHYWAAMEKEDEEVVGEFRGDKSTIPFWKERRLPYTNKDFADLEHLMISVDHRLNKVARRLESTIGVSNKLRSQIPKGIHMVQETRKVYSELENMFLPKEDPIKDAQKLLTEEHISRIHGIS